LTDTSEITRVFQAFVAPAIFVSATSLLLLSINVRLMGIVSRLRQYAHARDEAVTAKDPQKVEAYTFQIDEIEKRAVIVRRCFLLVLTSLSGTTASCLLLGIGVYWKRAAEVAVAIFVLAMLSLLAGTLQYISEVSLALKSVHEEVARKTSTDHGA
jgi:hypothetical protein